ncbi:hypothetical protein SAPIO_CDS0501 [Scedosporium apiospermum]|uniref:SAP domain-containing protein n=1 Tax=Pseudallescheria apiosperma TaxID=563466 RepID=A0A084GH54_PSEDA|nr:uncharacterized protein SAPIO_CDS0501 [Scedosporium apiospermum]KEZ46666.1 hypothetical protein SAPIO_CDS0501 [Scedosporium apiospermum]
MEYTSMKVPELRKLLQERSLPVTGNKADLVARLQENDKKTAPEAQSAEDEIDYSDDDVAITTKKNEATTEAEKPDVAETEAAPAEVAKEGEAADAVTDSPATVTGAAANGEASADAPAAAEDEAAAEKFALNLPPTSAEDEAKKREERAKRFGLVEDDDERKKADRAKRFGIDSSSLATSLDSALPDRPLKRGRAREDDGGDNKKRQSNNRRDNRRHGRGRGGRFNNRRAGGGRSEGGSRGSILSDPAEKAKAEARAKRFGSG